MSKAGRRLIEAVRACREQIARQSPVTQRMLSENPEALKDLLRERMHRRAQKAEGNIKRAIFWIECIEQRGNEAGDAYLSAWLARRIAWRRRNEGP